MSYIATTIEQSKHLLELGLDHKTADCNWNTTFGDWFLCIGKNKLPHAVPAWSLSALLEVMPIKITKDKVEYKLAIFPSGLFSTHSDTSTWTVQYCGKDYSYRSKDRFPKLAIFKEYTLIDAVHEMVCWLLEQGFIKKGGEQ